MRPVLDLSNGSSQVTNKNSSIIERLSPTVLVHETCGIDYRNLVKSNNSIMDLKFSTGT